MKMKKKNIYDSESVYYFLCPPLLNQIKWGVNEDQHRNVKSTYMNYILNKDD